MTINSKLVTPLHPDSDRFFDIDWTDTLADGVTISTTTWTLDAVFTNNEERQSGLAVGVRISQSGATEEQTYNVTCKITTSNNQTFHEIIPIKVSSATGL